MLSQPLQSVLLSFSQGMKGGCFFVGYYVRWHRWITVSVATHGQDANATAFAGLAGNVATCTGRWSFHSRQWMLGLPLIQVCGCAFEAHEDAVPSSAHLPRRTRTETVWFGSSWFGTRPSRLPRGARHGASTLVSQRSYRPGRASLSHEPSDMDPGSPCASPPRIKLA